MGKKANCFLEGVEKIGSPYRESKARSLPYTVYKVDPGWRESLSVKSRARMLIGEHVGPRGKEGLPPT